MINRYLFLLILLIFIVPAYGITNFNSCTNFNIANELYNLTQSFSTSSVIGNSFDAENITVECNGFTIVQNGIDGQRTSVFFENNGTLTDYYGTIQNCYLILNYTDGVVNSAVKGLRAFDTNRNWTFYNTTITIINDTG